MYPVLDDLGAILEYNKAHKGGGYDINSPTSWDWGWRKDPMSGERAWHNGIDLGSPSGTKIYAPMDGAIHVWQDNLNGNGIRLYVQHETIASIGGAHLSAYADGICEGCRVKRGQLIGYVGSTGKSTGAHLHITFWGKQATSIDGVQHFDVDPMPYLEGAVAASSGKKKMMGLGIAGAGLLAAFLLFLVFRKSS
jgi:murein DD-endopeptidase MepM/ murein hydrolase activator NlpD